MKMRSTTVPEISAARAIYEAVTSMARDECGPDEDDWTPLYSAMRHALTSTGRLAIARAILAERHALSDPPYRVGGAQCDPRLTAIADALASVPHALTWEG